MGTRPVQAHVGPASSSALSAPLLSHPVTHHAHRSVLVQTASLRLPTAQRAQQGCAELPLKSPCRRTPTWQTNRSALQLSPADTAAGHSPSGTAGQEAHAPLTVRRGRRYHPRGTQQRLLPPAGGGRPCRPPGGHALRGSLQALPLTTHAHPFTPALRANDKPSLPAGNLRSRGMKRREMDRVCCAQTLSRHRDGGRGGGTQPHRNAWEVSARACGLAKPRRKGS